MLKSGRQGRNRKRVIAAPLQSRLSAGTCQGPYFGRPYPGAKRVRDIPQKNIAKSGSRRGIGARYLAIWQ